MATAYKIPKHVHAVIDQSGAVLLDIRQGSYFSLNDVGLEIWQQLQQGRSLGDIETHLLTTFDVTGEIARGDLADFILLLKKGNLLDVAD